MTAVLATDLFEQARIALEAAETHLRTAGTPSNPQEASNLAAAFRAHQQTAVQVRRLHNLFDMHVPTGCWEFGDGRVERLPNFGRPVWVTGLRQATFAVGEFEGLRPRRWQQQEDWS